MQNSDAVVQPPPARPQASRNRLLFWLVVAAGLGVLAYTQLTIFVVQPIGAVPDGRTLIMRRSGKLQFIDSADAVCAREQGGVSLLCRGAVLGAVGDSDRILARLPYSATLYSISTGGKSYDR